MTSQELRKNIEQIFNQLRNGDPAEKLTGYTSLRREAEVLHAALSHEQVNELIEIIGNETAQGLRHEGILVALKMALLAAQSRQVPQLTKSWRDLGDWLWRNFKEKSAVITVVDPKANRRDEPAEVQIFRRLSFDDFPLTEQHHIILPQQRAHLVLTEGYKAVCVIGRPGLLGSALLDLIRFSPPTAKKKRRVNLQATRFRFDVDHRPKGLARKKIDPGYHYIVERHDDGTDFKHQTVDSRVQRIDYGIVQRYVVEVSGQTIVVVICAGASSLGTLGAAKWASLMLYLRESLIDLKGVLREDSCMEALLRVTADSTIGAWESATVDLISLYVDGKVRFVKQCADGPEEITLVYRNNTPAKVLLDGSDPDMKAEFDMFKLHFALGESVLDESKHVTIADLQSLLKKGDKQISKKEALKILAQLRIRYLHGALVVAADRASIQCKVKRLDL